MLCGVALKAGTPEDAHFRTARHRKKEKSFQRAYGKELSQKLEKLMNRWSRVRASPPRRK